MAKLSHVDGDGRAVMVDVSGKPVEPRFARACGRIHLKKETASLVAENRIKKGDVVTVAKLAGIQAAKRAFELIPLCHPLQIGKIDVSVSLHERSVEVTSEVSSAGQTGVEMEALVAVSIALLAIYDMCKGVDRTMRISDIVLLEKKKGRRNSPRSTRDSS